MTLSVLAVFAILAATFVVFLTGALRLDVAALLVLVTLALTGLVTPAQALSGFSNPAVVTVWAMFIVSGALARTGVAEAIGRLLVRVAGTGEARMVAVLMGSAGLLSGFMNNVGVVALMLPVTMHVSRQTGHPPSRLLLPLAMAAQLGGLTTLIGTPPNLLVSDALRDSGGPAFSLFEFAPIGVVLLVAGTAFVTLYGRRLLPRHDPVRDDQAGRARAGLYQLGERVFGLRIPEDSPLGGRSLAETRIGSALRLNVVAILRGTRSRLAPGPATVLRGGDRLLALGNPQLVEQLRSGVEPFVDAGVLPIDTMLRGIDLVQAQVPEGSPLVGRTLLQAGLRGRLGVSVLAVRRGESVRFDNLPGMRLAAGDTLLLQVPIERVEALAQANELGRPMPVPIHEIHAVYGLHDRLQALRIPEGSILAGRSVAETRLADALGLSIWAIRRDAATFVPEPGERFAAGDTLLVDGPADVLETVRALRAVQLESHPIDDLSALESADVGLAEIVLSPTTALQGKSIREVEFRERYGATVLAIWRQGEVHRMNLRDMDLRFGDAVLVHGSRENLRRLARDPDFIVVSELGAIPTRPERAPVSLVILAAMLVSVLSGWLPVALAAVSAATAMVLTRCLTMEDAYRLIEWRAVFLIAGLLPLGIAMEQTGAAGVLGAGIRLLAGPFGPHAALALLFVLTALGTQVVHPAALVVLMAPIAVAAAGDLGVSPLPMLMTVAMGAGCFAAVSHPANTMVLGPGGYRFADLLRIGIPITVIAFVLVVLLVPVLWPFVPAVPLP